MIVSCGKVRTHVSQDPASKLVALVQESVLYEMPNKGRLTSIQGILELIIIDCSTMIYGSRSNSA